MVCVAGDTIPNGGCGTSDINDIAVKGSTDTIKLEQSGCGGGSPGKDCGKMIFFLDESPKDHQFTDDFGDGVDTVYEVREGGNGDYVQGGLYGLCKYGIRLYCDPKFNYSYCDTATDTSAGATSFEPVSPAICNHITRECECPSGFTRYTLYHSYSSGHGCGHGAWYKRITCIKD